MLDTIFHCRPIADRTGIGEAVTGAILLGAVTSLSGIMTSVVAAIQLDAALAVSNSVGGIVAQTVFLAIADDQFGTPFDRETESLSTPSPLNMFHTSLAYVQDSSVPAFTGPVAGRRMRLEVSPTVGSLDYISALADYRRYFFMRPVTLAFRALHSGRYWRDSEDSRLSPNFVGYESLVRGYNFASFDPAECSQSADNSCPEINRLTGSRMAISNLELRFPLLGPEEFALFGTRIIPTTLTTFFDGGVIWTKNEAPELKWERESTERIPVFSAGASLRVNILGYLIAELYYAVPFQRPEKGGYLGFHISPGW